MTQRHRTLIPDEHVRPDQTLRLASHPPTRLKGNAQGDRAPDLYYEVFRGQQGAAVYSIAEARSVAELNGLRLPRAYAGGRTDPLDLIRSSQRNSILNLLAALISFRAVTNGQAATLTGNTAYADPRGPAIASLFRSGLIDLSPAHLDHGLGDVGHGAAVYQLGDTKVVRELCDHLTFSEWLALTGNRPLPASRVNVRHDVLGLELALRASRLRSVGAVLGPHFSTFLDPHHPDLRDAKQGGPDVVLVTENGLRVAVEVTATIGRGFTDKVAKWGQWLQENPFERSGVVVVFLTAPSLQDMQRRGGWVRAETHRVIAREVSLNFGSVRDPVAPRIGVASWQEWCPGPWLASDRFRNFTVHRPTGPGRAWEPADLASETPPWSDPSSAKPRLVHRNAALLGQTPRWLRARHRPWDLAADLLREHAGPSPTLLPRRPGAGTRAPGLAQGAASDAHLPPRLLGPTGDALSEHHRVSAPHRPPTSWPPPRPAIRPRPDARERNDAQ